MSVYPETMHEVGHHEPKWVYGKRRVVEPEWVLTPAELAGRVCDVFGCPYLEHLPLSKEAA